MTSEPDRSDAATAGHLPDRNDAATAGHLPDPAPGVDQLDAAVAGVNQIVATAQRHPSRVVVRCGAARVEVQWPGPAPGPPAPADQFQPAPADRRANATHPAPATEQPAGWDVSGQRPDPAQPDPAEPSITITSPMVGTFYHAPEPGSPPFVRIGDVIRAGQQVGIVEAMKLMNAIEAEADGEVASILTEDGKPVEYGQPLIRLRPLPE